jgi:hypothetical protein
MTGTDSLWPPIENGVAETPDALAAPKALAPVMLTLVKDNSRVYIRFVEHESFKSFVKDKALALTA